MRIRLVLLLCAAAAIGLFFAGCEDKTAGDEQTLTYTEGKGDFTPIGNVSRNSSQPGSGFALTIPLQDDSGTEAGTLYAVCVAAQESSGRDLVGTCNGTVKFDSGTLALNVGGTLGESVTGAITGGSGDYEGASGAFESNSDNPPTDTFTYTLP